MILKDQFLYDFNKTIYSKMITEPSLGHAVPTHFYKIILWTHHVSDANRINW